MFPSFYNLSDASGMAKYVTSPVDWVRKSHEYRSVRPLPGRQLGRDDPPRSLSLATPCNLVPSSYFIFKVVE